MTQQAPIIELDQITKSYVTGDVSIEVLKGINLRIYPREYVALMGRSGAGKSTLMNILGCLDLPTSGTYKLAGEDISALDDDALSAVRGQRIGFIFQSFHLLKDLDVTENVELPMQYLGVDPGERRERAVSLLKRVGLGHRLGHRTQQLSGGERQRVAIARALSNRPKVLLADEPTGNLDSGARDSVLALFEELIDQDHLTLVMVTHDDLIGELAGRRVVVGDGRIVDDGCDR